jgi:spermidine/putrescine transport system ATP-binding protein
MKVRGDVENAVAEGDVSLDRITKRFDEVVAVDNLTLDVPAGHFFSLLGPSGCGKTTTLRMIGGFEEPTRGRVHLGGRDVTALPPYRRDVNTVFQSYALFPHLTVEENIAFGLKRKKRPKDEISKRVGEALDLVALTGLGRRKPNHLSGGQQQRVALARALVNHPQVLLLDEPLGALDLKIRKQMQLELKRIQNEVGITFLYVTHDQEEAMTMSDWIAVMRDGRVEQMGAPEDVYERPASEFVAGFLGASNLLAGEIKERARGEVTVLVEGGSTARVPAARVDGVAEKVKVGVRPEKIRLQALEDGAPDGSNQVEGMLVMSTFVGVGHQYEIQGPGGKQLRVYAQNVGDQRAFATGQRVRLVWRPEHTFVVPDTGDGVDGRSDEAS